MGDTTGIGALSEINLALAQPRAIICVYSTNYVCNYTSGINFVFPLRSRLRQIQRSYP